MPETNGFSTHDLLEKIDKKLDIINDKTTELCSWKKNTVDPILEKHSTRIRWLERYVWVAIGAVGILSYIFRGGK